MPRTLWRETPEGRRERVGEDDLLGRGESLVVLGEPGMGKTHVLERFAKRAGVAYCTARQLINRPDPFTLDLRRRLIVIDALDEVAARQDGDAVDLVLRRLGALGHPRFVLACRVADWQAATSVAAIGEQYPVEPLQFHLEPLARDEQIAILSMRLRGRRAAELIEHFEIHGLDFLGNPQTLDLIARLPADRPLPTSRSALFQLAVETLRVEHRDGLRRQELPMQVALDAAGAACASLILTGASTIRRGGQANVREGELSFAETDALAGGSLAEALGTRLFAGAEDSFTYWHRRVGEFLGAAWLARRADTPAKRRRLLRLFHEGGLVPTSLRGLHAWLARDPHLADAVIRADPMGVVEYGDADGMSTSEARVLFEALEDLAQKHPTFWRRGSHRARVLVNGHLEASTQRVICDPSAPVAFRLQLLEQITEARHAEPYRNALRRILQDTSAVFAIRWQAGTALATVDGEDWPVLVTALRLQADRDSVRLAYDMMRTAGLDAFTDRQVVEVVLSYDGLILSGWPKEPPERLAARFWNLPDLVPPGRLDGVLDEMVFYLSELLFQEKGIERNDLIDALHGLVLRRLDAGPVQPLRLWRWLQPLGGTHSYHRDKADVLAQRLRDMDELRRTIQRHVLLDTRAKPIWWKQRRLDRINRGFELDEADVVAMLSALEPSGEGDDRWFEILTMVPHDVEGGRAARDVAARLVGDDAERRQRIAGLTKRVVPDWERNRRRRIGRHAAKRAKQVARARKDFGSNIERLRGGAFGWLHGPAAAYLKLLDFEVGVEIPAHERVAEWLGPEIAEVAHEGFDRFLRSQPPRPSATRMALSFARDRRYPAGIIIAAALAERLRLRSEAFADLPDERLMAGLFELWGTGIDEHAGLTGLADALEADLRARGAWEAAIRLFIGTQLRRSRMHVDRLHHVMDEERDAELATGLALEWLRRYPDLASETESPLIDRVLRSSRRHELGPIAGARRSVPLDDAKRRNWDAVEVLLDLDAAAPRLDGAIEPELLWHLRSRAAGGRGDDRPPLVLDPSQIHWIVTAFRGLWSARGFPSGSFTGDTNAWDATSYLSGLVSRLGEDTSDDAIAAMAALADVPGDGYTDHVRTVAAEQRRKRVEQSYDPPSLTDIAAILEGRRPVDAADLQAAMLENIRVAQDMVRGSDVDWYRGFFREDGRHKNEEPCRDELIKLLRTIDGQLQYEPESHGADDKRVDIVVRAGSALILPIEIKGQWHPDLWTAADAQLDHLYINDWQAKRGVYLVLWFGKAGRVTPPPAGMAKPQTPGELCEALRAAGSAARAGRVEIVVFDLTRQKPGHGNSTPSPYAWSVTSQGSSTFLSATDGP